MLNKLCYFIEDLNKIDSSLINDQTLAEIAENIDSGENDFEAENYRFINENWIDGIMQEELLDDLYLLGCFNASFLASIDGFPLDHDDIKAIQDAGAFEAVGKIAARYIGEIVKEYVRADGYGHHFASYDCNEHYMGVSGKDWYVFRIN